MSCECRVRFIVKIKLVKVKQLKDDHVLFIAMSFSLYLTYFTDMGAGILRLLYSKWQIGTSLRHSVFHLCYNFMVNKVPQYLDVSANGISSTIVWNFWRRTPLGAAMTQAYSGAAEGRTPGHIIDRVAGRRRAGARSLSFSITSLPRPHNLPR